MPKWKEIYKAVYNNIKKEQLKIWVKINQEYDKKEWNLRGIKVSKVKIFIFTFDNGVLTLNVV